MAVTFFYASIAAVWIVLLLCIRKRPLTFGYIIIAIFGMGYSLLYETTLGGYLKLYYYITPDSSLLNIIISAVLLYPVMEVLYVMFLPDESNSIILYTVAWIAALLIFELITLYTKTLVFTGWKLMPWSIITYLATFIWINLLQKQLKKRGL